MKKIFAAAALLALTATAKASTGLAAYVIPAKMTRAGVRPLYPCRTCSGTGEDSNEGDACHDCGGSGGLTAPAGA